MMSKNDLICAAAILGILGLAYLREMVVRADEWLAARRKMLCAVHKASASSKKAIELEQRLKRMCKTRLLK
jgi:hypothetical protein